MELRRAADALLRTQTTLSFLTPAVRRQSGFCSSINSSHQQLHRTFTSSSQVYSLPTGKNPTTEAAPAAAPEAPPASQVAPAWTSRDRSSRERLLNGGSSASLVLDAVNDMRRGSSSSKFDFGRMADPRPTSDIVGDIMRNVNETVAAPPPPREPMRLVPATGRTVTVRQGMDVGTALRQLEQSCARNKVRADFTKQRFHERGGLKRKRLRRERWRKKFMTGFRQYIGRVMELKKQGW